MFRILVATVFVLLPCSVFAAAICTTPVLIENLSTRTGGWVHVLAVGLSNADLSNCGNGTEAGLILNYNDTNGSVEGKRMVYSTLLTAFVSSKPVVLCADGCDSQYSTFSRLVYVNVE